MTGSTFKNIGVMTGIAVVHTGRHSVYPVAVITIGLPQVRVVGIGHIPLCVGTDQAVLCQLDQVLITTMALKTEGYGIFFYLRPDSGFLGNIFVRSFQIGCIMTGQAMVSCKCMLIGQQTVSCHRSCFQQVAGGTGLILVPNELRLRFIGIRLGDGGLSRFGRNESAVTRCNPR